MNTIHEEVQSLSKENKKLHMAYYQLKKNITTKTTTQTSPLGNPTMKSRKPEKPTPLVISDTKSPGKVAKNEDNSPRHDKDKDNDDTGFDLALEFNLTACACKGDVTKKFKGANGTTKLKQYCNKANIIYINKDDAIKAVWAQLEPILNIR